MATSYPTGLDSFTAIGALDGMDDEVGTRTHSEMHNDANDAIEAIEAELGTSPSGSYDTVAARLTAIDPALFTLKASNLSDLASAATARTNLGLGSAATSAATAFDAAGSAAAAQSAAQSYAAALVDDLSGVTDAAAARTALGLGTIATGTATDYLAKAGNLAGLVDVAAARTNLGLGTAAVANTGTGAAEVILGNDSRLTDTRTPSAASIVDAMISTTLSPSKITGTAAILGANTFTGAQFIDGSANAIQLRVQGHSTQTNDIFKVETSAGTKVGGWDQSGQLNTQYLTDLTGASPYLRFQTTSLIAINQGNAANVVFGVRGMAAQSGLLTRWEDSASTLLASVSSTGLGNFVGGLMVNASNYFQVTSGGLVGIGIAANSAQTVLVAPPSTTNKALTIRGLASQSGNLQEWQNSASTALASVSAAGLGTFTGVTSTALVTTPASTTASAGLNIPPGTTPTSPTSGDVWMTSGAGLLWRNGAATRTAVAIEGAQTITGAKTFSATLTTAASATGGAGLNLPHGTAPTAPVNGDMWTTTAGLYVRINGATVGPLS